MHIEYSEKEYFILRKYCSKYIQITSQSLSKINHAARKYSAQTVRTGNASKGA